MKRMGLLLMVLAAGLGVLWNAGRSRPLVAGVRAGGPRTARARQKTVVLTASQARLSSLVVPLKPRPNGSTEGQLTIYNKQGRPQGDCPLKHTDVSADISGGGFSRVTVRQQFHNPSQEAVEAVYTFPLPDDAAVDDMTMTIGTRVIKGEIKRREEARRIYDDAKNNGQAAALLDQERPNIFTQSVANVMPGQDVTISIEYVNVLPYDEGRYTFAFPMVVGPRYVPSGGYAQPGKRGEPSDAGPAPGTNAVVKDADKITPPIAPPGTRAGHDISLTVHLDAGLPLQGVESVLHDVDVSKEGEGRATVTLRNGTDIPNRDFILRYGVAGGDMQEGLSAHADGTGGGTFTLILQPPAAPPQSMVAPKEMVFVIDQTGSQSGWPIQKAKETMRHCIRHMNAHDTFQLIGFNTEIYPCFPAPVPATAANVQRAMAFLDPIEGGGGTDILKSVNYALALPDDPARLRIVCYMTDGYVGNDMQILDFIGKNRGRARMFPFGVGNSVNRFLIDGMAREGRGEADYVTLDEDGQAAAEKFQRRIASPVLLDPSVDWGGLPVEEVFPRHIPDVFSYGPIVLKGRYTAAAAGDIVVRGILRGQPWERRIHVSLPARRDEGAAIPTLWARAKIEDLQSQDWMGAQRGQPDAAIKTQIVDTALKYRLMSQYTSFVAVERRVVNQGGAQRTVDVPVEMPQGMAFDSIFDKLEDNSLSFGAAPGQTATFGLRAKIAPARIAGSGAFSGGAFAPPTVNSPVPALSSITSYQPKRRELAATEAVDKDLALAEGKPSALKRLQEMPEKDRVTALRSAKLSSGLQNLAETVKKEGRNGSLHKTGYPFVDHGRVDVRVELNALPAGGLKTLKALGFTLTATPDAKTLLGTLPVEKLDALLALPFIARVSSPTAG